MFLRRTFGCFGTSCGSLSTTLPRAGSSSTTSPPLRVRVPRHVARLITPLVVDYSASRRLVVDYFASAARPGASARRAARHATHHVTRHAACHAAHRAARRRLLHLAQARRQLLRLRRASGYLGTSRGSSRGSSRRSSSTTPPRAGSSSTTSPTPRVQVPRHVARLVTRIVVDYFAYAARPSASARRSARHMAHRRLLRAPRLRLAATLALLQPCRAS
jgi:hypothetical protein